MLSLGANTRIYLANAPTDLRKSFNGLSALVEGSFGKDATSGDFFIFLNRRATQVRILWV
ncbi:MAG: IS66 family insertion sequence element accessory protein TnpB [Myxococcales bacterium]|nr:IS66 family insertion sequence element accessory protein TnpB [Myxococcales bacterium]